jgi:hypothetical protein
MNDALAISAAPLFICWSAACAACSPCDWFSAPLAIPTIAVATSPLEAATSSLMLERSEAKVEIRSAVETVSPHDVAELPGHPVEGAGEGGELALHLQLPARPDAQVARAELLGRAHELRQREGDVAHRAHDGEPREEPRPQRKEDEEELAAVGVVLEPPRGGLHLLRLPRAHLADGVLQVERLRAHGSHPAHGGITVPHVGLGVGERVLHLDAGVERIDPGDLLLLRNGKVLQVAVAAAPLVRLEAVLGEGAGDLRRGAHQVALAGGDLAQDQPLQRGADLGARLERPQPGLRVVNDPADGEPAERRPAQDQEAEERAGNEELAADGGEDAAPPQPPRPGAGSFGRGRAALRRGARRVGGGEAAIGRRRIGRVHWRGEGRPGSMRGQDARILPASGGSCQRAGPRRSASRRGRGGTGAPARAPRARPVADPGRVVAPRRAPG